MRTRIIPAQITTVEDRIAGNLNLTQLLLLMVPVFWTTILFVIMSPRLHVSIVKVVLVLIVAAICICLSMRIKGKVVLSWVGILLSYNLRPRYYILNKNDTYLRDMHLPVFEKRQFRLFKKIKRVAKEKIIHPQISLTNLVQLDSILANPNISLTLKTNKKGGLNVGIEQIK